VGRAGEPVSVFNLDAPQLKSGGEGKKWRGGENFTLLTPPKNRYLPTTGVVERQKF